MAMVDAYETRVTSGEVPDWEAYEASHYGYPTYENQSYGFDATIGFVKQSARHIQSVCKDKGIALRGTTKERQAA